MAFISVTRLRIRSVRFLPAFLWDIMRTRRQIGAAPGFNGGSLLADRDWAFWTLTAWDSQDSMRRYMTTGSHKTAMPHLLEWCDEASVVHWEQVTDALPDWGEADRRMRASGRASKVRYPGPQHAMLRYRAPRTTAGASIRPSAPR